MLGSGKTGRVRASATASSAPSRDSYQRYAVALYRQALLTLDDSRPQRDMAALLHGTAQADSLAGRPPSRTAIKQVALLQADGNPAEAGTGISTGALPAPG